MTNNNCTGTYCPCDNCKELRVYHEGPPSTVDDFIELVLDIIDTEEELEGPPPSELKLIAKELRAAVRATKASIRKRFLERVYKEGLTKKQY